MKISSYFKLIAILWFVSLLIIPFTARAEGINFSAISAIIINTQLLKPEILLARPAIPDGLRRAILTEEPPSCEELHRDGADTDGDQKIDACDNCAEVPNPSQADIDEDGIGDACQGELIEESPASDESETLEPSAPSEGGCTLMQGSGSLTSSLINLAFLLGIATSYMFIKKNRLT